MDIMVTMAITAVMATLVGKDILATISPAALGAVLSVDSNDPHCSNI